MDFSSPATIHERFALNQKISTERKKYSLIIYGAKTIGKMCVTLRAQMPRRLRQMQGSPLSIIMSLIRKNQKQLDIFTAGMKTLHIMDYRDMLLAKRQQKGILRKQSAISFVDKKNQN